MSYAKIASTTWELNRPARSCVAGTDGEYAFEFEHELGCPAQGSYQDCTCYVSRIRLVETPVGRIIPTTEPDLSTNVRFWHKRAESLSRERLALIIALCVSSIAHLVLALIS